MVSTISVGSQCFWETAQTCFVRQINGFFEKFDSVRIVAASLMNTLQYALERVDETRDLRLKVSKCSCLS